jgi:hypothetical protein
MTKRNIFELGGVLAATVLVALGIAALVMGVNGHGTVNTSLKQEQITGTPDMTPAGIAPEVAQIKAAQAKLVTQLKAAGVPFTPTPVSAPSCSVAGKLVNTGDRAHCFANYMRIHALGGTNGLVYSQMGRFIAKPGTPLKFTDGIGGTSNDKFAAFNPQTKQPLDNGRRSLWVTEIALTTALNASYMASQVSLFGVVVGLALLLSGLGFGVLALFGALRNPETALGFARRWRGKPTGAAPLPTI